MQVKKRLLLLSSKPRTDESFIGYLLRLTELNKFSTLSWILQLAQIKNFARSNLSFAFNPSLNLLPLEQLTGVNTTELGVLPYSPINRTRPLMGDYLMFGSHVPQYMIRLRHPKVCTSCLIEDSYARKIWDLAPITTCPTHKCLLLDECPNCKRRISWVRQKVSFCQCGFDWRELEIQAVEDLELRASQQIYLRCNLQFPEAITSGRIVNDQFSGLNLKQFLSALFFIASQYAGVMDTKGKYLAPSIRVRELHTLLCKALSVFDKWPDNYFVFLDWRRRQVPDAQKGGGLSNEFSGYKSALYMQLASGHFDFMRSAFEGYLSSQWEGGYTAHLRRLGEAVKRNGKYVSRREAKELLRVGVKGIDGLIAGGKLKAVVRHREGSRLILIDRASLQRFKHELEQSLYMKQAEKLLGISRKRIIELVNEGLLSPLRGPNVDGCSDWKFSRSDVTELLALTKGKIKVSNKEIGSSISFLMVLRMLAHTNIDMARFVKAIIDGEIAPCGEGAKQGLAALVFLKAEVSDYASRQRPK